MSVWNRWVDLTRRKETGTAVAVFRIAMGFSILWTLGSVVWTGSVQPLWFDQAYGGVRRLTGHGLVALLGGATPTVIHGLTALGFALGVALILGIGGRATAFLTLLVVKPLIDVNDDAGGSYDLLVQNGLWLLVLAPSTRTLSLDCRLTTGGWTSLRPVGVWARYLIAFQLVLMYTSTGWQKLSAYWTPGGDFSALYYILQQPSWQRFDMTWTVHVYPLLQLATAITWLWEVTNPLLLVAVWMADTRGRPGRVRAWFNRLHVREIYVGLGLMMHLSLLVLMNVGPFAPLSLAFYAGLYASRDWENAWRRWLMRPRREAGA